MENPIQTQIPFRNSGNGYNNTLIEPFASSREFQSSHRPISLDSSIYLEQKRKRKKRKNPIRSFSAGETQQHFMSPLSFEDIDVVNTPLSSLRSCSEYNRFNPIFQQPNNKSNESLQTKVTNKNWFNIFSWKNSQKRVEGKLKSNLKEKSNEERNFLIEKFRFNPANLVEGEDYNYWINEENDDNRCFGMMSFVPNDDTDGMKRKSSNSISLPKRSRELRHKESFFQHSYVAMDYLFGLKVTDGSSPMEIELKEIKKSKITYENEEIKSRQNSISELERRHSRISINQDNLVLRLSSSLQDLRILEDISYSRRGSRDMSYAEENLISSLPLLSQSSTNIISHQVPTILVDDSDDAYSFKIIINNLIRNSKNLTERLWKYLITICRKYYQHDRSEEMFYEHIRIQPFSAGAYLRGMLLAGMSSTFFQIYNISSWSLLTLNIGSNYFYLQWFLYSLLLLQVIINVVQLPIRIHLHFLCWESSRAIEVDTAIQTLRNLLGSDSWLVNKLVNRFLDFLSIVNLLIMEIYLWITEKNDPLRGLIISLAATNLLTFVCRMIIATIFSLSMHDPHVLSEARRRGLSKIDLDVLPTFVYTKPSEVNNCDCSICLESFEMGEMLLSLPCDKKHSFHSGCIRQWLQRQNSCPLCQKMI